MAEETKKPEMKKTEEKKVDANNKVTETKVEPAKTEIKIEDKKVEEKKKVEIVKKDKAYARGIDLRISPKYSIFVCRAIKGKTPENAIKRLEAVLKFKRPIPMNSLEVAHQKGRGIAGAKFPKNVCEEMINLIKQVKANASVVGIENPVITIAQADKSQGPHKSGGRRAKRAHVYIEVMEKSKLKGNKK